MLIFNKQCYDSHTFDQYLLSENTQKDLQLASGYRSDTLKFKDPRTNEEFNFDYAVSRMIHRKISVCDLKAILVSRISGLTIEESTIYVPSHDDRFKAITVDEFVSHVTNARAPRALVRQLYHEQISRLARNGLQNQPVQTTILRQNTDIVLESHPDHTTPSSSSASDNDNANDNFSRIQRNQYNQIAIRNTSIHRVGNNENQNDNSITRNDPILLDTSSDDDGNIVDTLLVDNERKVSTTSEEGSIVINDASSQVVNTTRPSLINLTVPTTTIATRQ